jgi:hypothetical protein
METLEFMYLQKWFWGAIPQEIASPAISSKNPGTYLVRLNTGLNVPISDCPFTILVVTKNSTGEGTIVKTLRVWFRPNRTGTNRRRKFLI